MSAIADTRQQGGGVGGACYGPWSPQRGGGSRAQASSSSSSTGGARGQEDLAESRAPRVALAQADPNRRPPQPQKRTRCDPKHLATKGKAKAVCRTEGNEETVLFSGLLDPHVGALWGYRCCEWYRGRGKDWEGVSQT